MAADRYLNLKANEVGIDLRTSEPVLVTNLICMLPHFSTGVYDLYEATHKEGCLLVPYEGLVFEMDGDVVKTWGMQNIRLRLLDRASEAVSASIKKQMAAMIEAMKKERR